MKTTHIPVLLKEVLHLAINNSEVIVDCTLGRGGHFFEMLKHTNTIIGFDSDLDSIELVVEKLKVLGFEESMLNSEIILFKQGDKKVYIVNKNFVEISSVLKELELDPTFILADLGISMYQLKDTSRGFSFINLSDKLDMRINTICGPSAADLLNALSISQLSDLLRNLGEVGSASSKAKQIVEFRKYKKISTVQDLLDCLKLKKLPGQKTHPATKIFMALRIAVNKEHLNLNVFLEQVIKYKKCVAGIITFHSLEEKTVFRYVKDLDYKVYLPTESEKKENKSSRSAKLFEINLK